MKNFVNVVEIDTKPTHVNYATAKIEKFYKDKGFSIINNPTPEEASTEYIPTYVSVMFTKNRHMAEAYQDIPDVFIGGTGWDLTTNLPPEIEAVKPHINKGFITRGCNRSCGFCNVREKEGTIRQELELLDLWDGVSREITLLDNNILQIPEVFKQTCETAQKYKLMLDFNQGLDFRLITDEVTQILKKTRIKDIRLALDRPEYMPQFANALKTLHRSGCRKDPLVYVLVGYDTTPEEDLERLYYLQQEGCRPYVMRYDTINNYKQNAQRTYQFFNDLADWANQHRHFFKTNFQDFQLAKTLRTTKRHQNQIQKNISLAA
jgi:hypothetical protein